MDYILRFSDGSDGILTHSGVKGMKWGVWNEETKARYNGTKNLTAGGSSKDESQSVSGGGGGIVDEDEILTDEFMDKYAKENGLNLKNMTREQKKICVKDKMKNKMKGTVRRILGLDKTEGGNAHLSPNMLEIRRIERGDDEEKKRKQPNLPTTPKHNSDGTARKPIIP